MTTFVRLKYIENLPQPEQEETVNFDEYRQEFCTLVKLLTPLQQTVMFGILLGFSNQQIADKVKLYKAVIQYEKKRAIKKLRVLHYIMEQEPELLLKPLNLKETKWRRYHELFIRKGKYDSVCIKSLVECE